MDKKDKMDLMNIPEITKMMFYFYYNVPNLLLTGLKYGYDTLEKKKAEYEFNNKKLIAENSKNSLKSLLVFL